MGQHALSSRISCRIQGCLMAYLQHSCGSPASQTLLASKMPDRRMSTVPPTHYLLPQVLRPKVIFLSNCIAPTITLSRLPSGRLQVPRKTNDSLDKTFRTHSAGLMLRRISACVPQSRFERQYAPSCPYDCRILNGGQRLRQ